MDVIIVWKKTHELDFIATNFFRGNYSRTEIHDSFPKFWLLYCYGSDSFIYHINSMSFFCLATKLIRSLVDVSEDNRRCIIETEYIIVDIWFIKRVLLYRKPTSKLIGYAVTKILGFRNSFWTEVYTTVYLKNYCNSKFPISLCKSTEMISLSVRHAATFTLSQFYIL